MTFTVRARADAIATFRFISVSLMETLARWVPTTPELEVKVLFGRHLWELAQHADAFGRRTAELRLGPQVSRDPAPGFLAFLTTLRATTETAGRIAKFYDGALSRLESLYRDYLTRTDGLLDEPSVRILERALSDLTRLRHEAAEVRRERPEIGTVERSPDGTEPSPSLDAVVQFRSEQVGAESSPA